MSKLECLIDKNLGVAIVGLGVIGGSIAGALKSRGYTNVLGIDKQENTIKEAKKKGYIHAGSAFPDEILPLADIVIVCLYPQNTIDFIKNNLNHFKINGIITDVSGIKKEIMDDICGWLREDLEFIGGHPMSGNHSNGIDYSNPNMFVDSCYIITPSASNSKKSIGQIKNLAIDIGCKTVLELDACHHDEAIAVVSHMPHILALALMNIYDDSIADMLGPSFKDATRVAQINSKLWAELFISNKANIDEQIGLIQDKIEELREAISSSDVNKLEKIMDSAKQKRENIA